MDNKVLEAVKSAIGGANVLAGEKMSDHLSMKVGGPADYYLTPESAQALGKAVSILSGAGEKVYFLGNGSNVIISDAGYAGTIISTLKLADIETDGEIITAGAGATLKDVAGRALEDSLTGIEFACGIPGTVGGALAMNAGAYDHEISEVVVSVRAVDRNGAERTFAREEMEFGHRRSIFSSGEYCVLSADLRLRRGEQAAIRETMEDLTARRTAKQPLEYPSCGSVFKRPEGYFAGKLIQDAGLAGARVGGASVSTKHCGFIVNDAGGTAGDVTELIRQIKETVRDKSGVELECEVKIL